MKKKIFCFDLDNVLCRTKSNNYRYSIPIKTNIKIVNSLFEKGYYIKIFTARYMGRNNDSIYKAKKQGYELTKKQLEKWKINYHKLIFGKPSFDYYIDDKSIFYNKNWQKILRKNFILKKKY